MFKRAVSLFTDNNKVKGERSEDLPQEHNDLPDTSNPQGLCPRCNKQSSFAYMGSIPASFSGIRFAGSDRRDDIDRVSGLLCRNCDQPVIVLEEKYIGDANAKTEKGSGMVNYRGFFWWPFSQAVKSEFIPEEIQNAIQESKVTFSAQCYRASAVMARRALEAITIDKGITQGTLAQRIQKLKDNEIIDKNLREWANEIRLIGNNGAHYDPINGVSKADAKSIIAFIDELTKFIYIFPGEISKRRNGQ